MPPNALAAIRLLIFDLDGTLIDSKTDLALSVNAMLEKMGFELLPEEITASYVGHGVMALVRRALGELASAEQVRLGVSLFSDHYGRHLLDHTTTYPGVREALEELCDRKLAVLTNKPTRFSCEILAGLGLTRHFSVIHGGDSFARKKPEPIGVEKIVSDLQVSTREVLIVGDSDTDVLTGRNAGVWTCGVTYGFGSSTLEKAPPDVLLGDLRDLPLLLNSKRQSPGR